MEFAGTSPTTGTTGPLVNLFLTLGQGVVRLVAEPLHVHSTTSSAGSLLHTPEPGNRNLDLPVEDLVGDRPQGDPDRSVRDPLQRRPGRVDLGLGGAAGLGEGG